MVTAADLIAAVRKASLVASDIAGIKVHLRGLIGAERRILIERAKAGDPIRARKFGVYARQAWAQVSQFIETGRIS